MHYYKEKRAKVDFCNICGEFSKLSWDHVPPKCSNNKFDAKINIYSNGIPDADAKHYDKFFQNGVKFRSICEKCNNEVLGGLYDPALSMFVDRIHKAVMSKLLLPSIIHINCEINKVCKAICGHILAAKNFYDEYSKNEIILRKYVLNKDTSPPTGFKLLYWIYPYSTVFVMRDFVGNTYKGYSCPDGIISVMYSFPIAYLLVYDNKVDCGLNDLFKYCNGDIDKSVEVPICKRSMYYEDTKIFRDPLWPCNLYGDDSSTDFILTNSKSLRSSVVGAYSSVFAKAMKIR